MQDFSGLAFLVLIVIVAFLVALPGVEAGALLETVENLVGGILGREDQQKPQPQA